MASFVDPSFISKSTHQNIQNNPPLKFTLYERISQLFFRLYEKISHLFSRKPSQMKKLNGIEPIYDVPKNNQPVKKSTLYERISNFFSKGPSQAELLEERIHRDMTQLQHIYRMLRCCIYENVQRITNLETYTHNLKEVMDAKEVEKTSLKQTIPLEEELCSNKTQVNRSDSGFSESSSMEKKHSLFSKARSYLEAKIG